MTVEGALSSSQSFLPVERHYLLPHFEGYKLAPGKLISCSAEHDLSDYLSNVSADKEQNVDIDDNHDDAWYRFEGDARTLTGTTSMFEEMRFLSRLNHLFVVKETADTNFRHVWFFARRSLLVRACLDSTDVTRVHFDRLRLYPIDTVDAAGVYPPSGCLLSADEMLISNGSGGMSHVCWKTIPDTDGEGCLAINWNVDAFSDKVPFVILDGVCTVGESRCFVAVGTFVDRGTATSRGKSCHSVNIFNIDLVEIHEGGRKILVKTFVCRHPPDLVRFRTDEQGSVFLWVLAKDACFIDDDILDEASARVLSNLAQQSDLSLSEQKQNSAEKMSDRSTKRTDYRWTQTYEDLSVSIVTDDRDILISDVSVSLRPDAVSITIGQSVVWDRVFLYDHIVVEESTWCLDENRQTVSLSLVKHAPLRWPHLLKDDDGVAPSQTVTSAADNTAPWTANSTLVTDPFDRIEEIDYHQEQVTHVQVINDRGSIVAHHTYASTELVCHSFDASPRNAPLLVGLQFDVDALVMACCVSSVSTTTTPVAISLRHQSTLHAFSYVQASKRDRKFSYMTSDAAYACIAEYRGNVFIYRQPDRPAEQETRTATKRDRSVYAAQDILTCNAHPQAEIIGIQSLDARLCVLLTSRSLLVFRLS